MDIKNKIIEEMRKNYDQELTLKRTELSSNNEIK